MPSSPFQADDLSYLSGLDHASFEKERRRLIADAIGAVPAEHRAGCIQLQHELTEHRASHTPTEHLAYLSRRMSENLQNLSDAFGTVVHASGISPAVKAVQDR